MADIEVLGEMDNSDGTFESANRVYGRGGISPTVPTSCGGGHTPKIVDCVAMRGRAYRGEEQHLEVRDDDCTNTITTVEKDNYVMIRQATMGGRIRCNLPGIADLSYPSSKTRRGRVIEDGQVSPNLCTEGLPSVLEDWTWDIDGTTYLIRIRKLTPKECWRLMDFSDEDFEKAEEVNSNTQLYRQAGNSIVKNCLVELFRQMI